MKSGFRIIANIAVGLLVALSLAAGLAPPSAWAEADSVRLRDHVPGRAIADSHLQGRLAAGTQLSMVFSLPLQNQQELDQLLERLYDPADPLYGQYLSSDEFTSKFAPAQDDYDAVVAYAESLGFTVTGTHPNRTLINVSGPASAVERGFNLHLNSYQDKNGRNFYAPDSDPEVPALIASRLHGVVGLDNSAVWRPHNRPMTAGTSQIGSGPGGGLTPGDVTTAYNLNGAAATGTGQILGLFELDGYRPSDVTGYVNYFHLPAVPLQNVLVDGYSGRAGSGADEVTLDIELQIALAPGASQIIVYEGPNTNTGVVDTYNRIATDNLAKQISTSWGLSEGQSSSATLNAENSAFQQMAAQGQSIYAAAGDSGAYDNGSTLSVDDPSSQPYMVGVGGTQLYLNSDRSYNYETTWNVNGKVSGGAGGGGVSSVWSIPSWQQTVVGLASTTKRNVPDVSLNSDQYTGYSIFYNGGWYIYGGTSCAAPLWAAFTARVNQQRVANGQGFLGFANPPLYQLAGGANQTSDFHDVISGTNLFYSAAAGYDNATGWGSFNGAKLLADLAPVTGTAPAPPTGLTASGGNGSVTLGWTGSAGATSYNVYRGTSAGGEGATPIKTGIVSNGYTDSNLTNGTTYYYLVTAVANSLSSDFSNEAHATPAAPVLNITGGPTASTGRGSATISWTTNLAANSVVRYGTSVGSLKSSASSSSPVTSHAIGLNSLARRTQYYYQVSSTAGGVTVSSSPVSSFTTQ